MGTGAYFGDVQYKVLGPLEVCTATGEPRPIRRGRPRSLLHLLLMNRRVVVPVDVVADRLWEDELPQDASNAVHQLVSYLRRTLGTEAKRQLVTSPVGYCLRAADEEVDAWQFDRLLHVVTQEVAEGSAAAAERALSAADEASNLWRGEPYSESSGYEWSSGDINRLNEGYLQLQEARLEAMLRLGRHREVVIESQSLAAAYPLREQFHAQRALALYRSDRQSDALDALRGVRALLADELGLDPGPHLQLLEQQILRQDKELEWHPPPDSADVTQPAESIRPVPGKARAVDDPPVPRLPPRPPRLHGRDADVERLSGLLTPGSLVTVAGPAGIGKSALARTIARAGGRAPVWYVDLADVDKPALAATGIARHTGFSGPLPRDPSGVLASAFRSAAGLLVLDTCEHVIPDVALTLRAIRDAATELTVLTTSRRPLDLPEETVYRLVPLPTPGDADRRSVDELSRIASIQLFVERAMRLRSDFRLDQTTAEDIARIVSGMEGLPLGIELAAANADALDARGIRERLDRLLTAATQTTTSVPRRQASLTAALDSSCVLLTPQEKAVLGPLAVFHGAFDLEAVQAVVAPDIGDPYPTLASLVRQSMVSHEGDQTYRLLRPMRNYAVQKILASSEHDAVRHRHAAYLTMASSRAGQELRTSTTALTRLHRLLPDARAAIEWSLDHERLEQAADIATAYTWYWAINGLAEEGIRWLRAVSEGIDKARLEQPLETGREAAVLRSLGLLSNPIGSVRKARDYCRRAIDLSRSIDDEAGATAALLTLGIAEWALGDFGAAAAAHDEANDLAIRTGERWHRLSALTLRARTALDGGEPDALQRIEAAIAAGQDAGDRQMLSIAMSLLARHHLGGGQIDAAAVAAEHALREARRLHYREGELGALNLLGRARLGQGRTGQATACFTEALSAAVDINHRGAMCETMESLALGAAASGRYEHAYLLVHASARERTRLGLRLPTFGAQDLARIAGSSAEVLGSATALLDARITLISFDELVAGLVGSESVDRLTGAGGVAPSGAGAK